MLLINLSKQSDKFLDKLPPKQFKQIVKELFRLAKSPKQQDVIKLKGSNDFFRKDVGEYRIIYKADSEILYITVVGKRNDDEVYKIFDRK